MDEIITTRRQRLDLRLLRRFATRSSYVDQRVPLLREILGLSWLTPFSAAPMLLLCAGLALAPEQAEAAGATYTATEVASLPEGSTRVVRAVNDKGEIVGTVRFARGIRGFFLHGGVLQEIAGLPPGSDYSTALGINNNGQVVGSMNTPSGGMRAFRSRRAAGMVVLNTLPGDTSSAALAINTSGKAAGWSSGPTGVRAVTWSPADTIQALPMLPASSSCRSLAINDNNDVAGVCETASGLHAVLWAIGTDTAKDLGTLPGGFESAVLSINNKGDIVGSSGDTEGEHHAALWPAGRAIQDLGVLPNRISSQALAINNRNEVVGVSSESGDGGGEHAFLWTERDGMQDLNDLLASSSGFVLTHAIAISAQGLILAIGHDEITHSTDKSHEGHGLPLRVFLLSGLVGGP